MGVTFNLGYGKQTSDLGTRLKEGALGRRPSQGPPPPKKKAKQLCYYVRRGTVLERLLFLLPTRWFSLSTLLHVGPPAPALDVKVQCSHVAIGRSRIALLHGLESSAHSTSHNLNNPLCFHTVQVAAQICMPLLLTLEYGEVGGYLTCESHRYD